MLERALRQRVEQRPDPLREPPHHRVRERDGALEAGRAYELDRLVRGRACRDAVEVGELVGAEPKRRPDGRVELAHRPPAQRLDRVVERPDALHSAVGDPLRERAVAAVEPRDGAGEHAVGVGVLLEDAAHDLVRRPPRRRDHRSPRRNSS